MPKIIITETPNGKFFFYLKARNGRIPYKSVVFSQYSELLNTLQSVQDLAQERSNYSGRRTENGEPYFVITDQDGAILAKSGLYESHQNMKDAIESALRLTKIAVMELPENCTAS